MVLDRRSGTCQCEEHFNLSDDGTECEAVNYNDDCEADEYYDEEEDSCESCHMNCANCYGGEETECYACTDGMEMRDGACHCIHGY